MKDLIRILYVRLVLPIFEPVIVRLFHIIWYHSPNTWLKNKFLGYEILQCPFDLQLYQELIYNTKPDFILQTGIAGGGSLLYFASILDLMNEPSTKMVIGVDIKLSESARKLNHPRILILEGSSTDPDIIQQIENKIAGRTGLVILDSDHSKNHVYAEMKIYHKYVAKDSYLVVEDTNINGHPVSPFSGEGPFEAVKEFLKSNNAFLREDLVWKRNKFSFHQGGWLKRIY